MAGLTAGWPLLNLTVSDNQPVAPGARLSIGPDHAHTARFMVGTGWSLRSSRTDPKRVYSLRRGQVDLLVTYVSLRSGSQVAQLWPGLRQILQVANASARLTRPARVTDAQGVSGLSGAVTEQGRAGTATIFPDPAAGFAIELVILAPRGAGTASRGAARQVVRSILFPSPS